MPNRRKNVPDDCPLSDSEREGKIREVMRDELGRALDTYFSQSPFLVDAERHYKDHETMTKFRNDVETVKTSFIKSLARLFAAACVGAISWKAINTMWKG